MNVLISKDVGELYVGENRTNVPFNPNFFTFFILIYILDISKNSPKSNLPSCMANRR